MAIQASKITISLSSELVKLTDAIAKEKRTTRSKLVSHCLREMADKHFEESMARGYKKMAKDSLAFAKEAEHFAKDSLPEWK